MLGGIGCAPGYADPAPFDAFLILRLLEPTYKLVFVTSTATTGNLGGISGADASCQAGKGALNGTFKALLVDGISRTACTTANCGGGTSEHTDWVLASNKEYRRSDGTTVIGTTNANGLLPFSLSNSFATSAGWWTGLKTDWRILGAAFRCQTTTPWDTGNVTRSGGFGLNTSTNTSIEGSGAGDTCDFTYRLVCVQQ